MSKPPNWYFWEHGFVNLDNSLEQSSYSDHVFKFHTLKTNINVLLHHLETPATRLIQTNCCTTLSKVYNSQFKLKFRSNYKGKSEFETSNDFLNTYSFWYSPRRSDCHLIICWEILPTSCNLLVLISFFVHQISR